MNCPFHILIVKSRQRSYREFPIRLFEFGSVYRYEKSGVVHGLTRVRGMTQDDAQMCIRDRFLALLPPRGSVAASIQAVLPESLVSASFHHLPATEMETLTTPIAGDVMVCSDHAEATALTVALIDRIEGLRGIDAGSLAQAAPIEAFTAVLITVNIRHKVHTTVQLAGFGDR